MLIRVYLVDRRLKWLVEVPLENDNDFTVRQFLYKLFVQKLKIRHNYLHYSLYVHSEKREQQVKDLKKQRATSAGVVSNKERTLPSHDFDDDDQSEGGSKIDYYDEELTPILNLNQALDDIIEEFGVSVSFVARRRIFPPKYLQNFDVCVLDQRMTVKELEFLFAQISFDNIMKLAYNEENIALKQAAILEVIKILKAKKQLETTKQSGNAVVDNKVLSERVDIRELHKIYPQHLLTFFNKKSIWKRIQEAKVDLPFMSQIAQLQYLYLVLSLQQQPQVCAQYFPVRVVEFSKPLKPLMSQTLTKKHQPLLAIFPQGVGIANDYGPEPRSTKHKKLTLMIPYEQIREMHVMLVHPLSPDIPHTQMQKQSSTQLTTEQTKKQFQLSYTDNSGTQLRIVVESDRCQEIIRLIQDYMKDPDEVGWDAQHPKPKSLEYLKSSIKLLRLGFESRAALPQQNQLPQEFQLHAEIYDRLDEIFGCNNNNDQQYRRSTIRINDGQEIDQKMDILTMRDIVQLYRSKCPNLASYGYYDVLQDEYEKYQLELLQNLSRYCQWVNARKKIVKIVTKIQAVARGFILRRRLIKSVYHLKRHFAARIIQKTYRGYIVRRKIVEYLYHKLQQMGINDLQ